MTQRGDLPSHCSVCVYRRHSVDPFDGHDMLSCHRHAPSPSRGDDFEVVTWPTVKPNQRCGTGSLGAPDANGVPRRIVACELCVHWFSPPGGLATDLPGEYDDAWWQGAGLCLLRAPVPGVDANSEPTEWRATHFTDGCGDGQEIEPQTQARPIQLHAQGDADGLDEPRLPNPAA